MFQRRLLLLATAGLGVALLLAAQTARLATGDKEAQLTRLEDRLIRTRLIPTVRGRIFGSAPGDRPVLLATDAPGFDVAVQYAVLSGEWAYDQAGRAARREAGDRWYQLSPDARRVAIERVEPRYVAQAQRMFDDLAAITGTDRAELYERIDAVRRKVQRSKQRLWEIWRQREERRRGEAVSTFDVATPLAEEYDSHVLVHDVSADALDQVRAATALLNARQADGLADLLPEPLPNFIREILAGSSSSLEFMGGGAIVEANYHGPNGRFVLTMMADNPLVAASSDLFSNVDAGNPLGEVLQITGQDFLLGENGLSGLIGGRILVQASGGTPDDMIAHLERIDFGALAEFGQ